MRVLLLALLLAPLATASEVEVRLFETVSAAVQPRIAFPHVRLDLVAHRPPGFEALAGLSGRARFALVRLGGRTLRLAFDAPAGALALGVLRCPGVAGTAYGKARIEHQSKSLLVDFSDCDAGALRVDVQLRYRGTELAGAVLQPSRHRRGRAVLDGVTRVVIVVDADADGRYDGTDDRWMALKAERARGVPALRKAEGLLLAEPQVPFEADGTALMVREVAADGSRLVLYRARPEMSAGQVLERRWREVEEAYYAAFARERRKFAARHRLDLARPRVASPRRWRAGSLSEARARARRESKPLLAWYLTETNPWCFRLAYYTFADREVDELLGRFVLVRIDIDKDPERSYLKSGARGLPTLLALSADGKPIRFVARTPTADGRVKDLDRPDAVMTGWQRPQDLALNLKRILRANRG